MELVEEIEEVCKLVSPAGFIAGGAARYYWLAKKNIEKPKDIPNDIDVFCGNNQMQDWSVIGHSLLSNGYSMYEQIPGSTKFFNGTKKLMVQLVVPRTMQSGSKSYGSPMEVTSNFGFTVEQFALTWDTRDNHPYIVYLPESGNDVEDEVIRVSNGKFLPISYLWRATKYAVKGYYVSPTVILELVKLWDEYPESIKSQVERDIENHHESFGMEVESPIV